MSGQARRLHVIPSLERGGAETALVAHLLQGAPHTSRDHVLCLLKRGALAADLDARGIIVHEAGTGVWPLLPLATARCFNSLRPSLIVAWMYHAIGIATMGRQLARMREVPLAWCIRHGLSSLSTEKWTTRLTINGCAILSGNAAQILYNSKRAKSEHERIGYLEERSEVIPNGIDCQRFSPRDTGALALRRKLQVPPTARIIGTVGRHHPVKDHGSFLQAASRVLDSHPESHFVMVGRGLVPGGPVESLFGDQKLRSRTHLLGETDEVPEVLAGLDVFVLSSLSEGFPNVLGEAMASGVPCVSTDAGDAAMMLGGRDWIAKPGDAHQLGELVRRMLSLAPAQVEPIRGRNRERVLALYSLENVNRRFDEALERAASAGPPRASATDEPREWR